MSLSDQIKANTEILKRQPKIDLKDMKYKKILQRIEQLETDIIDITKSFQGEFDKINEFMGCLCAKLEELQSRLESLQNSTANRSG